MRKRIITVEFAVEFETDDEADVESAYLDRDADDPSRFLTDAGAAGEITGWETVAVAAVEEEATCPDNDEQSPKSG